MIKKFVFFFFLFNCSSVNAVDLQLGQKLFENNCNVCHYKGNNLIIPEKNLKKETLEMNGMDNIDSIIYQITNGKNGMPAFGGRLSENEIENIAEYVLSDLAFNS
jgi:cytochrome c6